MARRGRRARALGLALVACARGSQYPESEQYQVSPFGESSEHEELSVPHDCNGIDISELCSGEPSTTPPGPCCESDTLLVAKEFFHCGHPLHFSDQEKTFSRHGGAYHWDIHPATARFYRDPGSKLWYYGYQSNQGDGRRTHVSLEPADCPTETDWVRTDECSDDKTPFVRPVVCAEPDVHLVAIGKPGPFNFPEPPDWARPYVDEEGNVRVPAGYENSDDHELYGDILETHDEGVEWLDAPE